MLHLHYKTVHSFYNVYMTIVIRWREYYLIRISPVEFEISYIIVCLYESRFQPYTPIVSYKIKIKHST